MPARLLVRNVWVSEGRRRQGIARQLIAAAQAHAVVRGLSFLNLEVNADNAPAISLYKDLGFDELEPPPAFVPQWMRGALLMGKQL